MLNICSICGEPAEGYHLYQVYNAKLCTAHFNQWMAQSYTKTFLDFVQTHTAESYHIRNSRLDQAQDATRRKYDLKMELFEEARQWHQAQMNEYK